MKVTSALAVAIGLVGLAACNNTAREQAADNIEANAEMAADNLEEAAGDANTDATADSLQNQADAVRETGDKQAEDMRTNNPDTNLANGL